MIRFIVRHPIAVFLSVVLHIVLVFLVTFEWSEPNRTIKVSTQNSDEPQTNEFSKTHRLEPLKTFAVDASLVQQQLEKIRAQEEARKLESQLLEAKTSQERQQLKALQERQKAEQAKAEKARKLAAEQKAITEAERKKTEEAKRLAKLEKQKAEAAKKEAVLAEKERLKALEKVKKAEEIRLAEEKRKLALEKENAAKAKENEALKRAQEKAKAAAALQRQLDEEALEQRAAKKRKQMLSLRETYISAISAKVRDNWRTPARISPDAQCDLQITQTPNGSVTSVKILNCNEFATKQFREAAEKAVYRSEPIPAPPVKELFERVITFEFKP